VSGSCFAERFEHILPLTDREHRALEHLEETQRTVRRGAVVRRERDPASELYVIRKGWLMSYVLLDDGSRQILRLHFPGDLVGASSAAFGEAADSLVAVTDVVICPFEKSALRALFTDHPRLAALLFALTQAERVALTDRLASLGRTSAKARVAAFLIDILTRLRIMKVDLGDSFLLPLTQEEIGDATGLTAVHVNRMMRALVEEGLIARENGNIRILNEEWLVRIGNYINRYAEIDTAWLPPAN